jgi:hypothetical protein
VFWLHTLIRYCRGWNTVPLSKKTIQKCCTVVIGLLKQIFYCHGFDLRWAPFTYFGVLLGWLRFVFSVDLSWSWERERFGSFFADLGRSVVFTLRDSIFMPVLFTRLALLRSQVFTCSWSLCSRWFHLRSLSFCSILAPADCKNGTAKQAKISFFLDQSQIRI